MIIEKCNKMKQEPLTVDIDTVGQVKSEMPEIFFLIEPWWPLTIRKTMSTSFLQ